MLAADPVWSTEMRWHLALLTAAVAALFCIDALNLRANAS
jgi:hypothetical protein